MNRDRLPVLGVVLGALALLVLAPAAARAATPVSLGDLDVSTPSPRFDPQRAELSPPAQYASAGARVVFVVARSEGPSYEIWTTDGTPAGTQPLSAICGRASCTSEPRVVVEPGGLVYLSVPVAHAGGIDWALWATDGTEAGTVRLAALGSGGYGYVAHFELGGALYFAVNRAADGELWSTRGTVATTRRVASGMVFSGESAAAGDRAFFLASSPPVGFGLWTVEVGAPRPRFLRRVPRPEYFYGRIVDGRYVFFVGVEYVSEDLWASDGTTAGTVHLGRVGACSHYWGCSAYPIGDDGRRVLFWAGGLKATDGTRAGTVALTSGPSPGFAEALALRQHALLATAFYGTGGALWSLPVGGTTPRPLSGCPGGCPANLAAPLVRLGERALVVGRAADGRLDLWLSDGTAPGTRRIRALGGADDPVQTAVALPWGSRAAVAVAYAGHAELVVTDGTTGGTRRLAGLGSYAQYAPFAAATAGSRLVFTGYDPRLGVQPWASDGTPEGSRVLAVVEPQGASSTPRDFAPVGGGVVFAACDGTAVGLWASDGTADSSVELLPGRAGSGCDFGRLGPAVAARGLAYFARDDDGPEPGVRQLWATDGTPGGTRQLTFFTDAGAGDPLPLETGLVFVVQPLADGPAELWESDGTPGGTRRRFDLPAELSDVQALAPLGEDFYFVARLAAGGLRFFRSDGTAEGTRQISDVGPQELTPNYYGYPFAAPRFTKVGADVFYALCRDSGPCGLFRTRGTPETTVQVLESRDTNGYVAGGRFAAFAGRIYFFAGDGLWTSDGTAAGTRKVVKVGYDTYGEPELTATNDALYFAGLDGAYRRQLWRSDGTAAGTRRVIDLAPGTPASAPRGLVAAGSSVFFTAWDPEHGREAWTSDGTASGTTRLFDLAPGMASSAPSDLVISGDYLWLAANDGLLGREPWALSLAASAGPP